jgi:DNA-binding LacI/PurR family transcriptional regulator
VGAVAISCIRPVYAYLAEQYVPTVVLGSLYPDQQQLLPSIDHDHYQAGQLLAQCLIARGNRRLGLLLASPGRAGTEFFLNGVLAGVHAAHPIPVALATRAYPGNEDGNEDVFVAQVKELLSRADRPTALITQGAAIAGWVSRIAAEMGLPVPEQLDMAYLGEGWAHSETLPDCPYVEPQKSAPQILTRAVEMLRQLAQGIPLEQHTVTVPVRLHETDLIYRRNGDERAQPIDASNN